MSLLIEYHNSIAVITLNRPQKSHAYHYDMLLELQERLTQLPSSIVVLIVQSQGSRAFCGGADLHEMKTATPLSALNMLSQKVFDQLARYSAISIAAVHGAAVAGGCELALACDLRVAGPQGYFSLPETKLGLIPSAGGCTRLVQLVGATRAKAVILGGQIITAEQALDWGLLNRIAQNPQQEARQWAEQICQSNHLALRLAKMVIDEPSLTLERTAEALLYSQR